MKFVYQINNSPVALESEGSEGGVIVIAGKKYEVLSNGPEILVNGKKYFVNSFAEGLFQIDHHPFESTQIQIGDYTRREEGGEGGRQLHFSPLTGNVWKIKCQEGDLIKKGMVVLIIEAMKMENEIVAQMDGVIKTLHVREGQSVAVKAPLFTLEPPLPKSA